MILGPSPTVVAATVHLTYSDGSEVVLAAPGAEAVEVTTTPAGTSPLAQQWLDGLNFNAPYGRAERIIPAELPTDLVVRMTRVYAWRMAIRRPGEDWPEGVREWGAVAR